MIYAQYLRIEDEAGGVSCTSVDFIRAAWTFLGPVGKKHDARQQRHAWLRAGLKNLQESQRLCATLR
jgi:hypothetical protein